MTAFARILFLLLVTASLWAEPKALTRADVPRSMEEIFAFHVEYRDLTPLLIKRSFKLYLEQFDLEKSYLLASEVKPFLELSSSRIEQILLGYEKGSLAEYEDMNKLIEKAIERARSWRQEIERELILASKEPDLLPREAPAQFASTPQQLKERIRKQLTRFLLLERRYSSFSSWNAEKKSRVFALYEKRIQRIENSYFLSGPKAEHFFCLHVLKAFAKSLDAHTSFYSPEEAFEMRSSLEKKFEGVGVVLKETVDGVVIADLVSGGPAEKSQKVEPGDLLVSVDQKSVVGAPYEDVLEMLKGAEGAKVVLGLKRLNEGGGESYVEVSLKREKILMENERVQYTYESFGKGVVGKIVLPSFYESDGDSSCELDLREAIRGLKQKGELQGLVLDMRENSGGFLSQAVKVAGLFITSGVVVISKYSEGEVQYLRNLDGRVYYDGPLVILTSKASASAAEIVAQALQDYGTAIIVGDERTYGKGTIQYQTVTDKEAESFFKVTVGKYYTVSGRSTQIEGVQADIIVPTEYSIYNIGERFLEYPLPNDRVSSAYVDPLLDIDGANKPWFQKNYLPSLQKREICWTKMLPDLRDNSAYRLDNSRNFQLFLKTLQQIQNGSPTPLSEEDWGSEDLQMHEAVEILKDMIAKKAA